MMERYSLGASCVGCRLLQRDELIKNGKRAEYCKKHHNKMKAISSQIISSLTKLELKEIREEMRLFGTRISYKEALYSGAPYYCSGVKCKNGHIDIRNVDDRRCLSCQSEKAVGRKPKPWSERSEESKKKHNDATARWVARNKTQYREKQNTFSALRKSYQRQATPKWLSKEQREQIAEFYIIRNKITKETGIPHHVDHIVPLRGENVSGLHVPWNLQVISAEENNKKRNKYGDVTT